MPTEDVVIVGAGLAGLACARHLQRAGVDTTILEQSDGIGGRVRTDAVGGWRMDRGFQVLATAYPEARRVLDYAKLDLRPFTPGLMFHRNGKLHRLADPRRRPGELVSTLLAPYGPLRERIGLAALAGRAVLGRPPGHGPAARQSDTTTAELLHRHGISSRGAERVIGPFLSGLFLEPDLETSARFARLVVRSMGRGAIAVPASGMQVIPAQIVADLQPGSVQLDCGVHVAGPGVVRLASGDMRARCVVIATDPSTASRLVEGVGRVRMRAVTTVGYALDASPLGEPVLVVDADRLGPVLNTVVISDAAPGYAAEGRSLVVSSALGVAAPDTAGFERRIREHTAMLFGISPSDLEPVATYSIPEALPAMPAKVSFRKPVRLAEGLYVCGDHRDTSSIQGALVSGRRAGEAVLADLGVIGGRRAAAARR